MNLSDLRARFRLAVPEADTNVVTNSQLDALLNDGALDLARRTECLKNYADQDLTAATAEYDKPSDAIRIMGVYVGGTGSWEKMPQVTMDFLAHNVDDSYLDDTGVTYGWYDRRDKVGIYKIPTSTEAGTSYLRIYYVEKPDTMSDDSHVPFNSLNHLYPYHELVYMYATYKTKQAIGKWEQAKVIEADYLLKSMEMRMELSRLDGFLQPIRPIHDQGTAYSPKQNPLNQ